MLLFIHGGGWSGGARLSGVIPMLNPLLEQGISVASVEYRFINEATADGVVPPVKGPLTDAARALQFLRSKAGEWGLDKTKIGRAAARPGPAPRSGWPSTTTSLIRRARIRSRANRVVLSFAAVTGAQTTLDPAQMREWTPNSRYGGHAFGFAGDPEKKISQFDEFFAKRESILPWIAEYSPYALVSKDDPPVYLYYGAPPALGKEEKDPTHSANFGVKLQEHCVANGVKCELFYPGAPGDPTAGTLDYILKSFGKAPSAQ